MLRRRGPLLGPCGEVARRVAKAGGAAAPGWNEVVTACPTSRRMFERAGRKSEDLMGVLRRWMEQRGQREGVPRRQSSERQRCDRAGLERTASHAARMGRCRSSASSGARAPGPAAPRRRLPALPVAASRPAAPWRSRSAAVSRARVAASARLSATAAAASAALARAVQAPARAPRDRASAPGSLGGSHRVARRFQDRSEVRQPLGQAARWASSRSIAAAAMSAARAASRLSRSGGRSGRSRLVRHRAEAVDLGARLRRALLFARKRLLEVRQLARSSASRLARISRSAAAAPAAVETKPSQRRSRRRA